MKSTSVFLDITKVADFWWKNADVSRIDGVHHVIYIFFWSSLGKVQLSQISSLWDICDRFYEGGLFASSPCSISEQPQKDHPE